MRYKIEWSQGALKDIRRLDKPQIARITQAIEVFADAGRGDVKRLINADGAYRGRVESSVSPCSYRDSNYAHPGRVASG